MATDGRASYVVRVLIVSSVLKWRTYMNLPDAPCHATRLIAKAGQLSTLEDQTL